MPGSSGRSPRRRRSDDRAPRPHPRQYGALALDAAQPRRRATCWSTCPAFTAALVEDGRVITRHRTVVGARRTPTPQLSATITAVTINPWWNVPQSIIARKWRQFRRRLRGAPRRRHGSASASRRGRATRSAGSRSRCPTSTPSTCTTRRRRRCSAGRCARSAMAASAPRTSAISPPCCSRRPGSGTAPRSTARSRPGRNQQAALARRSRSISPISPPPRPATATSSPITTFTAATRRSAQALNRGRRRRAPQQASADYSANGPAARRGFSG